MHIMNRILPRRRIVVAAAAAIAAVSLSAAVVDARHAGHLERPDLTVKLAAGDVVALRGGPDSLGGTSAPVYSTATDRHLGSFVTEIETGPDVQTLLGIALESGTSRAPAVGLTLELGRGTVRERHTANVAVLAEPASEGYEFVVAVIGEGVLQPGTGVFENATGTSSLFLVFEVDADQQLPPLVRTGTLRFDFD